MPLLNKPYQRFHKMNHKNFKKKNTGHEFRAINILIVLTALWDYFMDENALSLCYLDCEIYVQD